MIFLKRCANLESRSARPKGHSNPTKGAEFAVKPGSNKHIILYIYIYSGRCDLMKSCENAGEVDFFSIF